MNTPLFRFVVLVYITFKYNCYRAMFSRLSQLPCVEVHILLVVVLITEHEVVLEV